MKHEFSIKKKDHKINQWLSLCSLYALDYASENILDDPEIKFNTRNRFSNIKTFANNIISKSFRLTDNKALTKTETEYIVYDHVVMMQKLFMLACAIPDHKLPDFLNAVTDLSSKLVYEEIEKNVEHE
jgi:hypothetical protein